MVAELHRALDDAEASPRVRVISLQGSGRSFCSGFDLSELQIGAAAAETRKVLDRGFSHHHEVLELNETDTGLRRMATRSAAALNWQWPAT
jgi:enoyl-CoA hydratase/carnithine racemase